MNTMNIIDIAMSMPGFLSTSMDVVAAIIAVNNEIVNFSSI
jgi:hypothetical protein